MAEQLPIVINHFYGVPSDPDTWLHIRDDGRGQLYGRRFDGAELWDDSRAWKRFFAETQAIDLTAALAGAKPVAVQGETAPQAWSLYDIGMVLARVQNAKQYAVADCNFDLAKECRDAIHELRKFTIAIEQAASIPTIQATVSEVRE